MENWPETQGIEEIEKGFKGEEKCGLIMLIYGNDKGLRGREFWGRTLLNWHEGELGDTKDRTLSIASEGLCCWGPYE